MRLEMKLALIALLAAPLWAADTPAVTFHKDVEAVLQKNCQTCHRPGEIAPMSFLTYESTRPWAKAIKSAVLTRKMPPWFADPQFGHFRNAPKLSEADVRILTEWADNGSPKGDVSDAPKPVNWPDGWQIQPDVVRSMTAPFPIPEKGVLELPNIVVPGFDKDTWVTSIEVRPGARSAVHHLVLSLRRHTDATKYDANMPAPKLRDDEGAQTTPITREQDSRFATQPFTNLLTVWVPGMPPLDFRDRNAALLIPAGYDLVLGMHYTTNGTATTDQTRIGFTVTDTPPARQWITESPTSPHDWERFRIPAGNPNWESTTEVVFNQDAELVWFMPHMHLRGKDMTYTLIYPTGEKEIVLSVPRYDFEWQLAYDVDKPIHVPKGTHLFVSAHYDNSANNKFNPNPNRDVYWGDQTWEEMMVPWFGIIVDRDVAARSVVTYAPGVR